MCVGLPFLYAAPLPVEFFHLLAMKHGSIPNSRALFSEYCNDSREQPPAWARGHGWDNSTLAQIHLAVMWLSVLDTQVRGACGVRGPSAWRQLLNRLKMGAYAGLGAWDVQDRGDG